MPRRLLALLPRGTAVVGAGVAIYGLTSYGFLVIAARSLGPTRYASLSALWAIVYVLGPGFFLPVEQEVNRLITRTVDGDVAPGPILRRAFVIAGVLATALTAIALAVAPLVLDRIFDGDGILLASLVLALVSYAAQHVARGALAGRRRYGHYSAVLGLEGVVRLVACAALATAGVTLAGAYGLVLGLAPLASTVAVRGALKPRGVSGRGPDWAELTAAIGYLVVSAVFAQFLAVVGPFVVKLLAEDGREAAASRFLASLAIARIPIFLFQAVQPPLLSRLSGLAAGGLLREFGRVLKRLLLAVGMMGGISIVLVWFLGPWIITTFFGQGFALGRPNLLYLAGGTAAYLLAVALAQGLIALSFHRRVAAAWVIGSAVFVVRILLESDIITRVAEGFLLGSTAAALAMTVGLVSGLRTGPARAGVTVPGPVAQEP